MVITGLTRNQVALTGLVGSNPTASARKNAVLIERHFFLFNKQQRRFSGIVSYCVCIYNTEEIYERCVPMVTSIA